MSRKTIINYHDSNLFRITSIFLMIFFFGLISASITHAETYTYVTQWGSSGTTSGQFSHPEGIAVDSLDNVYVADTYNHRIQVFDSNGNFIKFLGDIQSAESCSKGSGKGEFNEPVDITIDSLGNIYVAESGNNRIQKFDSKGNYLTQWGSFGSENGQFFALKSIAVDSLYNVYVADRVDNIQKFDSNGKFITKWGSYGSDNGQLNLPYDIAIDSSDNVYVADMYNNRIQKFNSNGKFINSLGSQVGDDRQFNNPSGVAVDSLGNIYVADKNNDRIQKFGSNGKIITKWGSSGSDNGQFIYPDGVAVDSSGNVYVNDPNNNRIQKFAIADETNNFPIKPLDELNNEPIVTDDRTNNSSVKSPEELNSESKGILTYDKPSLLEKISVIVGILASLVTVFGIIPSAYTKIKNRMESKRGNK